MKNIRECNLTETAHLVLIASIAKSGSVTRAVTVATNLHSNIVLGTVHCTSKTRRGLQRAA